MSQGKKFYVNSQELEEWWLGWMVTGDNFCWEQMSNMMYQICEGVARRFNAKPDSDEYVEHVHDAITQTLEKIKLGKLRYIRGKAPVFNLITTTVFRILYSKMNRQKKQREHDKRFMYEFVQKHMPELLPTIDYPYNQKKDSSDN